MEKYAGWRSKMLRSGLLNEFLQIAKDGNLLFCEQLNAIDINFIGPIAEGGSAKVFKV